MKSDFHLPRLLWLLVLFPLSALAQPEAELKVEGRVERMQICVSGVDLVRLDFNLNLRVETQGQKHIIFPKATPLVYYWRIAPDMETLVASDFGHIGWVTASEDVRDLPTTPRKNYRILKSGRSLEFSIEFSAFEKPLAPGNYLLQVIAENWHGPIDRIGELERNWRRYGKLWAKPFRSEPIEFTVPEGLNMAECK
jgi:hypothetical protein